MPKVVIKNSTRARQLRITVNRDGTVYVSKPRVITTADAFAFARKHIRWIKRQILRMSRLPLPSKYHPGASKREYVRDKDAAYQIIEPRVRHFAARYEVEVNKVSIRNQKSRWGSCSRNRNISINFKVAFLPEKLRDYIIVHEVCHLRQFNHSAAFWHEVSREVPDYEEICRELRSH